MAERIDIDGVRFRVGADLKDLEAGFKKGEQLGAEAGKKTGSKFSQAFGAVVSAVAGAQIVGAMKTAFDAANKLEKTMLGLQATAKLTGQSFAVLSKSVNDLAKDGVMNIDQAAQSMKVLAAQGVNAQKSFEFLEAAKKVSAFNNIVGDAGQGVADLVKALQTGSAELFENADPALGAVIKRLGGYAAVSQDVTKKQQFLNAVIEKGGKMTADYDKFLKSGGQSQVAFASATTTLAQTFGQKLQPAMAAAYNMGAKILTWVSDMIAGLDSTTVAVAAFGTAAFAGIATFAKGAALLPGIFGSIGMAVTASLGPIALMIAAISSLVIVIGKLSGDKSFETLNKNYKEQAKGIDELGKKINELSKVNKRTAQEELELINTKEQLRAQARALGLDYDKLAASGKNLIQILAEMKNKSRLNAQADLTPELNRAIIGAEQIEQGMAMRRGIINTLREQGREEEARAQEKFLLTDQISLEKQREKARKINAQIDAIGKEDVISGPQNAAPVTSGKAGPDFRFIRARDELRELSMQRTAFMSRVGTNSQEGREAALRFGIEEERIRGSLRQSMAEYIEDRYTAERQALELQHNEQIANVYELVNIKAMSEEEAEDKLQQLREAHARKTAMLTAESFARTMQGANMIAGGVGSLVNARDLGGALGGFGGISQGLGALSPKLAALGPIGQGLAAAGGVVSVLSGLFGKSDEQRAREAEAQKRRDEEAKALLELQANYQRSMLALQEAAARLPFENLSRQLRLIDINAQSQRVGGGNEAAIEQQRLAARQSAIQGVLTQEAGTIGGGQLFGGTQATPAGLTQFLNERASQSVAVAQFMALVNMLADPSMSFNRLKEVAGQLESYRGKIPDQLFSSVSNAIAAINAEDFGSAGGGTLAELRDYNQFGRRIYENRANAILSTISPVVGVAGSLSSEITRDTTTAENLLSVIEQQLQTQQEIQKNTKVTADRLSETPGRNSSIIDISRGFSRSLGAIVNPQLTNTGLPQSIAAAVLATDIQKSIQERTVKGIEDLVTIQRDSRELLSIIGKTLAGTNTANSALLVQLEDLYRRSMAA